MSAHEATLDRIIEDQRDEVARLRSLNAELLAACEEVVRIQEIPRCSAAAVALERFAPKLQAILAKARQASAFDPGQADSQTRDIPV